MSVLRPNDMPVEWLPSLSSRAGTHTHTRAHALRLSRKTGTFHGTLQSAPMLPTQTPRCSFAYVLCKTLCNDNVVLVFFHFPPERNEASGMDVRWMEDGFTSPLSSTTDTVTRAGKYTSLRYTASSSRLHGTIVAERRERVFYAKNSIPRNDGNVRQCAGV